ncbi:ATP-grasp fold amidoligase family protein [Planococcus sp. ISL-110]|uniref:ATP-grasp fold amidoligase family protein n=1 Tax=Planococcus sp. ISL-110 TaxID=2819167 RepID=UPI001BE9FEA0|nr:ATP-grasp fold amidoligase family protein [Planococcus sp. ISL-110]MBT2572024.1 glycosyl transferase [Planococcus sp. ISL-110]
MKKPSKIILYLSEKRFFNFLADETYLKLIFRVRTGKKLKLDNPLTFNEKLQWLKLNWRDPVAIKCADKYEVREFVSERIGGEYLNEIYGVFNKPEEIDLGKLSDSFVLKGTHGSGYNIVCKNKANLNWNLARTQMNQWLKVNYFWRNREWVYKEIKPRIVCEKLLDQGNGEELQDYRFFCFNGEPKFISVDFSITNKQKTRRNLYDLNWNLLSEEISYPKELSLVIEKPEKLNEMISLSKELARDFPHARVDFYYIKGKIIFGEITFFHQSGMAKIKPYKFDEIMGSWLRLPGFKS